MGKRALKESTGDLPPFESWYSSKKAVEAAASIGVDFIGMVKPKLKYSARMQ